MTTLLLAWAIAQVATDASSSLPTDVPLPEPSAIAQPAPIGEPQPEPVTPAEPDGILRATPWLGFRLNAELGFTFVGRNVVQFGRNGTRFNYVTEGGQDNLLLFARLSAEAELFHDHTIIFLYQPLDIRTQASFNRTQSFDGVSYPAGTAADVRYGFDFYRLSYLYDFLSSKKLELAIGVSLQLRNASLSFTSVDGSRRTVNNDIGFVPLLKLRSRYTFDNGLFLGVEIDGIYVSGKLIPTGSSNDFEASLFDGALRAGARLSPAVEVFGSFRFLAGGARATEKTPRAGTDGFSENWISTYIFSLGATLR